MKNSILASLLLLVPAFLFAIGPYKPGDKLINHAQSGLILRKTASPKGERIASLALGEEVTVIKNDKPKVAHEVTEFPGYKIKGFWAKVKTAAGQEGFVFDGYLSTHHVPGTIVVDDHSTEGNSVAELYLLGETSKKGVRINLKKQENVYENYRQLFKNGAEVLFQGGEGGSSQTLTFEKGVTVEEAYLIGKKLWLSDMKVKPSYKQHVITVNSEDELWQITVETKAGFAVLKMSHAD